MKARLIPLEDGEPVELSRDINVVGRKEDCDVRIDHKSVSKQHCVLVKTDGLVLLRDLGSTNGTRVNGQRVRRAALMPNDEVAFASARFKVAFGNVVAEKPKLAETQHLLPHEVDALIQSARQSSDPTTNSNQVEIHTQDLPDVYPEDVKGPDS